VYGIRNSLVVPNSLPVEYYRTPRLGRADWRKREGFGPDDLLFVCVAGLRAQKNHTQLIEAFAQGPARDARARLVLAGEGKERAGLEQQVRELGLETRVRFLSVRSDIPDLLGACDVFVLASHYEGLPLSVMEAMAAGLPVVSTAVGGVPEVLTDGLEGFLTTPGDTDRLAQAMLLLSADPALRKIMGMTGARRALEQFDISQMAATYGDIYSSLLERSRSRRN
jgi:glycosyltransferase involved in cell wall biosynthesis